MARLGEQETAVIVHRAVEVEHGWDPDRPGGTQRRQGSGRPPHVYQYGVGACHVFGRGDVSRNEQPVRRVVDDHALAGRIHEHRAQRRAESGDRPHPGRVDAGCPQIRNNRRPQRIVTDLTRVASFTAEAGNRHRRVGGHSAPHVAKVNCVVLPGSIGQRLDRKQEVLYGDTDAEDSAHEPNLMGGPAAADLTRDDGHRVGRAFAVMRYPAWLKNSAAFPEKSGVATRMPGDTGLDVMADRADAALYRAKTVGGDAIAA